MSQQFERVRTQAHATTLESSSSALSAGRAGLLAKRHKTQITSPV